MANGKKTNNDAFCSAEKKLNTSETDAPAKMQRMTLATKRTTAPVFHGFSGSWPALIMLTKDIARSYNTRLGVTRKFLLPHGQSRFIVAR
jgi:hypothetical protein